MGVIINPSRGVNHYASINRNGIYITKLSEIEVQTDENGDLLLDESNDPTIINVYKELGYSISADFSVWDNEQDYKNRDINTIIYSREVQVITATPPTNVYELLYNQLKKGVASYTDDI